MAYVKIVYQNSPSTATPLNAENLNHMDDQIALNDQRLTEIETSYVKSFNGRKGEVTPQSGDYNIGQITPLTGAQVGQVPVVVNHGTEEDPELVFEMGAGGGGGHSIIDSEGNTMPQEDAMQFADSFVSDDDVNGRTVVENIKEHTTKADYDNATEDGFHVIDDGNDVPIGEIEEDYVEVTADGDKTYAELLNTIFAMADTSKINQDSCFVVARANTFIAYPCYFGGSSEFRFTYSRITQTQSVFMTYKLSSSSGHYQDNNGTRTDESTSKPSNGTKLTLYYGNKKATVDLQTTANRCVTSDGGNVQQKLNTNELTVTPVNGTIQAGSVKRKDNLVVINLRYVSTSASAAGDIIVTLPYNITSNIAHVQLCNNKNYAIDLLLNKIRTNSAIASGETIIISGTVFVE